MHPTIRMLLVGVMVASLAGIVAIVVRDHAGGAHPRSTADVVGSTQSKAAAGHTGTGRAAVTSDDAPVATITLASPNSPLTDPDPTGATPNSAGEPASFWTLTLAYPTFCTPGTSVTPVLAWNAADTDTVAVSVDAPATVGGYGFYESVGTLTMPTIACIGAKGDPLPTTEYEIDAFGTDHTRLHVVVKVDMTVSPEQAA